MTKAVYVFANRSDAELAEKIVRVRVGDNPFYNPIAVEPILFQHCQTPCEVVG